jgi:hypothetical protein
MVPAAHLAAPLLRRAKLPESLAFLAPGAAVTCRFLAERSGNGEVVRWWRFCREGAAMATGECASFYAAALLLLVVLSLFVRAAFGWLPAYRRRELPSLGCVECGVCVRAREWWSGWVRETEAVFSSPKILKILQDSPSH